MGSVEYPISTLTLMWYLAHQVAVDLNLILYYKPLLGSDSLWGCHIPLIYMGNILWLLSYDGVCSSLWGCLCLIYCYTPMIPWAERNYVRRPKAQNPYRHHTTISIFVVFISPGLTQEVRHKATLLEDLTNQPGVSSHPWNTGLRFLQEPTISTNSLLLVCFSSQHNQCEAGGTPWKEVLKTTEG